MQTSVTSKALVTEHRRWPQRTSTVQRSAEASLLPLRTCDEPILLGNQESESRERENGISSCHGIMVNVFIKCAPPNIYYIKFKTHDDDCKNNQKWAILIYIEAISFVLDFIPIISVKQIYRARFNGFFLVDVIHLLTHTHAHIRIYSLPWIWFFFVAVHATRDEVTLTQACHSFGLSPRVYDISWLRTEREIIRQRLLVLFTAIDERSTWDVQTLPSNILYHLWYLFHRGQVFPATQKKT